MKILIILELDKIVHTYTFLIGWENDKEKKYTKILVTPLRPLGHHILYTRLSDKAVYFP